MEKGFQLLQEGNPDEAASELTLQREVRQANR